MANASILNRIYLSIARFRFPAFMLDLNTVRKRGTRVTSTHSCGGIVIRGHVHCMRNTHAGAPQAATTLEARNCKVQHALGLRNYVHRDPDANCSWRSLALRGGEHSSLWPAAASHGNFLERRPQFLRSRSRAGSSGFAGAVSCIVGAAGATR
jgi:hypothetical protein